MFYVYILQSLKSEKFYVGSTQNPDERLNRHNSGRVTSTKNKGPWSIVLVEQFQTRSEACIREKQIKSYKSGQAFKNLILK